MPGMESYERAYERLAAGGPEWLIDLRRRGFGSFQEQGFPKRRNEDWRFTRTAPIQALDFELAGRYQSNGLSAKLAGMTFDDADCHRIAIVDGHFDPELSRIGDLPKGVRAMSLAQAITEVPDLVQAHLGQIADTTANPFTGLNTAFVNDGAFLHLADGAVADKPFHFAFVSTGKGTVSHPRILVVAGKDSEASIVETWSATGEAYFSNSVVEVACGANARVSHCKVQRERQDAFHIASLQSTLERDARFSSENISIGGSLVRNDVGAHLGGEGIDCRLDGLYLADDRQHVDNHTFIRHAKPHCHSFELYKGILADKSRGVFNGRIYVDPDAQKTDAKQENNCILLSDDARINTNPQLEIFADDVKCTHGATIGQLDEEAVFYLRSRGIGAADARHMLIHAFAGEVLERIEVEAVRNPLEAELFSWLERTTAGATA